MAQSLVVVPNDGSRKDFSPLVEMTDCRIALELGLI